MKKISVTFHKGKIEATGSGFQGKNCEAMFQSLEAVIGGKKVKEEITEEGCMREDPMETSQASEIYQ